MHWKKYKAYYRDNPEGYWFKRKLYGWGWTPVTWQGWGVTALYVAVVVTLGLQLPEGATDSAVVQQFILPFFFATFVFLVILWRTGESPRWQWGPKQSTDAKNVPRQ